jgi:hypothetical protein
MSPNEIVRFIVALVAAPLAIGVSRRIDMPSVVLPFAVAYAAMVTAYALALAESPATAAVLGPLRHVCILVSALGMLAVALMIRSIAVEQRRLGS